MLPTDEPRQGSRPLGVETAADNALADDPPRQYRLSKPFELVRPDSLIDEYIAEEPAGAFGNQHGIGVGRGLQTRRQVRSDADRRLLLCGSFAEGLTDNDQSGRNAHSHLQRFTGRQQKPADLCHEIEPRPHRPFGIVFMGLRIAQISENAVAHVSGDMPAHMFDCGRTSRSEPTDDLS